MRRRWHLVPQWMAGAVLAGMLLLCLAPQIAATHDPLQTQPAQRLRVPSLTHLAGTDYLGRDVWSRVVHGARFSLVPAVVVVLGAGVAGTLLGLASGYLGGWADDGLMRTTDIFLAVPALILAMAITTALGP